MGKLKEELEGLNFLKYKKGLQKDEMVAEIIIEFYKILGANEGWDEKKVYKVLGIRDIYELNGFDNEKLHGMLMFIDDNFTAGRKYAPF